MVPETDISRQELEDRETSPKLADEYDKRNLAMALVNPI